MYRWIWQIKFARKCSRRKKKELSEKLFPVAIQTRLDRLDRLTEENQDNNERLNRLTEETEDLKLSLDASSKEIFEEK